MDRHLELQASAAAYCDAFRQDRRTLDAEGILLYLSGDKKIPKPEQRIPLLHWLSNWAGHNHHKSLMSTMARDLSTGLPQPSPLTKPQRISELKANALALTYPGIKSRLALLDVPSARD